MHLPRDPISYVLLEGEPYHKMRVLTDLKRTDLPEYEEIRRQLLVSVNQDGGWPWLGAWPFPEPRPSSVSDSARTISLLLESGQSAGSVPIRRGLEFLEGLQRTDGGWSENPALAKALHEDWIWFSGQHSVTWISGEVLAALIWAGYLQSPPARMGLEFLREMQNSEGGWPSHSGSQDLDETHLWTMAEAVKPFILAGEPQDSPLITKAKEAVCRHRDRWAEPVENPLGFFLLVGLESDHPDVRKCLQLSVKAQNSDGGWGYYRGMSSHPDQTTGCIANLVRCGVRFAGEREKP
jgi:squalene cyclase